MQRRLICPRQRSFLATSCWLGDLIPADCRIIDSNTLYIDQVLLTGEPYPVDKAAGESSDTKVTLSEVRNSVFMGTSVISGSARVLVCRTGQETELGKI